MRPRPFVRVTTRLHQFRGRCNGFWYIDRFMRSFLLVVTFLAQVPLFGADRTVYRFDFGDDYQQVAPGYQPVSRVFRSPRYLWVSRISDGARPDNPDPLLRDFATGPEGEFWVGLEDGEYRITAIMSDSLM